MRQVHFLFTNPIFLSGLFGWFTAQFIKAIIAVVKRVISGDSQGSLFATLLWTTGGMPSSHSSLVSAITTSIGIVYGVSSTIFILSFFYAMIIIRDALGVRRSAGIQAKALNKITEHLNSQSDYDGKKVKEINGHSPPEVTVGIILGVFTALGFCLL